MPITSVLRGQIRPLAGYKYQGYTLSVKKPPVDEQIREITNKIREITPKIREGD